METSAVLSLLPAPIVAAALYFLLRYKYRTGKFGLVHKTFLLGLLGIIPVYLIDRLISGLHLDSLHSLNRTLFYAFVLTGGVFEFWKFLVLKFFVYPSKQVNKTIDVIIYSVIIAAGFTTAYSFYALYFAPSYINVGLYALTIGPVFVSISLIMGYFTGRSLDNKFPFIEQMTGLFIAAVFQGIYRFCLLTSDTLLMYLAVGGMLLTGISLLVISLREPSGSD